MNFYEQIFSRGRATGEGMTHFERLFAAKFGGSPPPEVREYTGAVPVTITADGSPLLDYLITGNTTQSGTPTPDNPIMPQGTGERTENLWDEEYPNISETIRYIPLYVGEGSFTLSTTTPYTAGVANVFLLSGNVSSGASTLNNGAWLNHKVTAQSDDGYVTIAYRHYTGTTSPVDFQTMLNTGSTPLPYEPYGYKIPILSANTTTPVYLGEVETTRRIKKLVLTGQETGWLKNDSIALNNAYYRNISGYYRYNGLCSHYAIVDDVRAETGIYFGGNINFLTLLSDEIDTVDKWKTFLQQQYAAGTPVTIWYVLATPETGIVNQPIRKIGNYADTLSKEQAGANIPTNNGSTTVDVDTTVKPSEVYIKYMG